MHFVAWNGEQWSAPFEPNTLLSDSCGGLINTDGCSVAWNADGYRGENWIALRDWTEKKADAVRAACKAASEKD
jgi:hypothetical protein